LSESWPEITLSDLVEIKHGFAFKGEYFTNEPTGVVLLTPGNFAIGGGFQFNKLKFYRDGPIPPDYVLQPGDLLVTMTDLSKAGDTLGYSAVVPTSEYLMLHNQRLGKVTAKREGVDLGFVHWLLRDERYRAEVLGSATGSTVRHTSPGRIGGYRFRLPPLPEQRAIAATLSALDDKIELNRKMNATLEAMARALFRDWFVDFGPTRAKMEGRAPYLSPDLWSLFPDHLDAEGKPEGWKSAKLGAVTSELRRGVSPKYTTVGGIMVLNQKCIRNREVGTAPARFHDNTKKDVSNRLIQAGDILVNSTGVGTLGRVAQLWKLQTPMIVDSHVTVVRPETSEVSLSYLGVTLTEREPEIEALGEGSTGQTELSRARLAELDVLIPDQRVQAAFDSFAVSILDRMEASRAESRTLAQTRDLLLPRLMSGELRVTDALSKLEIA